MKYILLSVYILTCCVFGFWAYCLQNEIHYLQVENQLSDMGNKNQNMSRLIDVAQLQKNIIDVKQKLSRHNNSILYLEYKIRAQKEVTFYLNSGEEKHFIEYERLENKAQEILNNI